MESAQAVYIMQARRLGDYQNMSVGELADGYCKATDNHDDIKRGQYLSALVLRFWYQAGRMQKICKGVRDYEYEDYIAKLTECIIDALNYRTWQDPTKNTNAQACINQLIASRGAPEILRVSNLAKQKVNYMCSSLDTKLDNDSDDTFADILVDEREIVEQHNREDADLARSYIQQFVNKNRIIEAIILDTIAFNDCEKHTKKNVSKVDEDGTEYKYVETSSEFWAYKLVQELNALPEDYKKYFAKYYKIGEAGTEKLDIALKNLSKCNNQKLHKYIKNTLSYAKSALQANA